MAYQYPVELRQLMIPNRRPPLDTAEFPRHLEYPFDNLNELGGRDLLLILRTFACARNLPAQYRIIRPLNFTKYSIQDLRVQYQNFGVFRPIYFFHHWGIHPEKENRDMSQRTMNETVHRCVWKRIGRKSCYYRFENRPDLRLGYRTRYKMYDSIEGRPDGANNFNLEEYRLESHLYINHPDAEPETDNKQTHWAIVKMWYGASVAIPGNP